MQNNILADLLFIQNPEVIRVSKFLLLGTQKFLGVFFLFGLILEFFSGWNFKGVLGRFLFAAIFLASIETILEKGVKLSFNISQDILQKYSPNNALINEIKKGRDLEKKESLDKSKGNFNPITYLTNWSIDSTTSLVLWILKFLSFLLLKHIYSLIYFLFYGLVGISALLSILTVSSKSLEGSIKTLFWLFLTPLILTIILILMDGIYDFTKDRGIPVVANLENSLHLLITCISLLMAPVFSTALIVGSGLSDVGNKIASMGAMGGLLWSQKLFTSPIKGVTSQIKNHAKSYSGAKISSSFSSMKKGLRSKADEIRERKNLHPNNPDIYDENLRPAMGIPSNNIIKDPIKRKLFSAKETLKNTTASEKAIIVGDNLFNKNKKIGLKSINKRNALSPHPISNKEKLKTSLEAQKNILIKNNPNLVKKARNFITKTNDTSKIPYKEFSEQEIRTALILAKSKRAKGSNDWIKNKGLYLDIAKKYPRKTHKGSQL